MKFCFLLWQNDSRTVAIINTVYRDAVTSEILIRVHSNIEEKNSGVFKDFQATNE